ANDKAYSDGTKTNDLKKKQAVSGLNASVKTLLLAADAKYRTNYDNYLKLKDSVWSKFELRKTYGLNLSIDEYEEFVQIVIDSIGVKVDEAERIIFVGCNYYRIFIAGLEDPSKVKFDTCPYCNKIYKKGEKSCPHCGKPLEIICWNCHSKMAYSKTNQTCPSCGATPQAQETLRKKSEALDNLLRLPRPDIQNLETALLELRNVIPNYTSFTESVAYKKIKSYDEAIKERREIESKLGNSYREDEKKITKLVAERKYFTAEGQAKSLKTKYGTYNADNTTKLIASISAVTVKAQQFISLAKAAMAKNDAKSAISNAAKAIDLCDDCVEARSVLQKYPPAPPLSARCTANSNAVKVEWTIAGEQDFVTYTVIKKIGVVPTSAEDGSIVAENLSIAFVEDATIVPATRYCYAVFAERYGIKSRIVVTQAPPIYSDVTQVRQEVVNDCIKVAWTAPQNVKEIRVSKRSGNIAPDKIEAGEEVHCDLTGFTDSSVSGENAYLIVCVYDQGVLSRGVRSVFKPYRALNAVKNPALKHESGTRYIFSGESDGNEVKCYYSETKLPVPVGKTQRLNDFGTVGKGLKPLTATVNMEGETVITLPAGMLGWVYP
ncbi:MAG: zinc ribbon domain-containing protein, partial [Candidatus Coproplasma sp.]